MKHWAVTLTSRSGEQRMVTVALSPDALADCRRNARVAGNVARAHAARLAIQQMPPDFIAFRLEPEVLQ